MAVKCSKVGKLRHSLYGRDDNAVAVVATRLHSCLKSDLKPCFSRYQIFVALKTAYAGKGLLKRKINDF